MSKKLDNERRERLEKLAARLGVKFRDITLLDRALTHASYANEAHRGAEHNERLEYLGDAVLELASSTYLYEHFPKLTEGELTKARAAVVRSATLAKAAQKLGLGQMLLFGHGEEQSGGRNRATNLEDAFEAVIGAIYLDHGWETARDYVWRQLSGEMDEVGATEEWRDSKTVLQELAQKEGYKVTYELTGESGPAHEKSFTVAVKLQGKILGEGTAGSKKQAEQLAAKAALDGWEK
ncbi:MAG: ribonuclease III [Selenomonadaceae bacterium]|nr:ribonuclease III [Selenomonadaceae bacterium]